MCKSVHWLILLVCIEWIYTYCCMLHIIMLLHIPHTEIVVGQCDSYGVPKNELIKLI